MDADGNWLRQTDGKILDKAIEREVEAMGNTERYQNHTRTVDNHSTESVGGYQDDRGSRRAQAVVGRICEPGGNG